MKRLELGLPSVAATADRQVVSPRR